MYRPSHITNNHSQITFKKIKKTTHKPQISQIAKVISNNSSLYQINKNTHSNSATHQHPIVKKLKLKYSTTIKYYKIIKVISHIGL